MTTAVVHARIPKDKARRVELLAQLRNVDRTDIIETGIDLVLCAAPERPALDAMIAQQDGNQDTEQ